MHSARRIVAHAVAIAACLLAGAAQAEDPPRRLVYVPGPGAERCPSPRELQERVLAHLGYDAFVEAPGAMEEIVVAIRLAGGRLVASIERRDAHGAVVGKKELTSAARDCEELASAAAFAVAFAIDPARAREEPIARVEPTPPPAAPTTPPPAAAPAQSPSETPIAPPPSAPREPVRLRLGLTALASFGAEPSPSGGASGFVGAAYRAFSIDLEGRGDLSESGDGGAVRASLLVGSLAPCFAYRVFRGCAIGSLGTLHGSSPAAQADTLWAAAGARAAVELPIGDLVRLRPVADLEALLTRTSLVVDDQAVWTTPAFTVAIGVGVVVETR